MEQKSKENARAQARAPIKVGFCRAIASLSIVNVEMHIYSYIVLLPYFTAFERASFYPYWSRTRDDIRSPISTPKTRADFVFDRISAATPTILQTAVIGAT